MKAWILGIFLVLGGLVLALGLWLLGYHLTGRRAFLSWKAERLAMGDRLEWAELVPPAVPPERNVAEAPFLRGAIVAKGQVDPRFKALKLPASAQEGLGNWREGTRDDLGRIAAGFGDPDLGSALKAREEALTLLEEASLRPACRFPIQYEEGELPALQGFRDAFRTLRVRAIFHLREGRKQQALSDLRTCFRMVEHLRHEPHLLSALLRTALVTNAMQVVWEGLEDRLWEVPHLEVIQAELAKTDLLDSLQRAWQAERLNFIGVMSASAENRPLPRFWEDARPQEVRLGTLGRGWIYRNLLVWARAMTQLVDLQDPRGHRVFPSRDLDPVAWERSMRFRLDLVMARIAIPALGGQARRVGELQAQVDQGVVVCALERHRIQRGAYPNHLDELVAAGLNALPHDLVLGRPLHYSRSGEAFTLYQVGWNGKDDGGSAGWVGQGKNRTREAETGDWVWPRAR